jgi:predicted metalloprotease
VIGLLVVAILAVLTIGVVVLVGDGDGDSNGDGEQAGPELAPDEDRVVRPEALPAAAEKIEVQGASEGPYGEDMRAAIADVDAYWKREFEPTFGTPYETVTGGFFAVTEADRSIPCTEAASDVEGNAFYCPSEDVVAWDADDLIPHMVESYGPLGLGLVIAHEWGHAVQARAGETDRTPVLVLEQQADCYAGAWVADVRDGGEDRYFVVNDRTLDLALAGFLELRDTPGTTRADAGAHGTAFDRIRAFQEGVDGGATVCGYTAEDLSPRLVDLPFTDQADFDSGGNLPLQDAFDLTVADLADFWTNAWPSVGGKGSFQAPEVAVFSEDDRPDCDDPVGLSDEVFYCPSDDRLAVQDDGLVKELHDRIGDYALSQVIGSGYSLAAMDQLGILDGDSEDTTRTADCLSGVWSASVFSQNRETAQLRLSPGDLDEAVSALLTTADHGEDSRTGSGAARVAAYRDGFMDGADACLR